MLPHPDECEIRLATEEERYKMYALCAPVFAPNISTERFLENNRRKFSPSVSEAKRSRSWVLVKKGDPNSPLYSHAETIHRDGWAKDADGMRDAAIYGVDMVVTPEEYRRKGYSQRLLRMLHYLLAPTQNIGAYPESWAPLPSRPKEFFPPADMCYLSSIAPPGFYENCFVGPDEDKRTGWASRRVENAEIVWDMTDLGGGGEDASNSEYQVLYHKDIADIADQIAEAHKTTLEKTEVKPGETVCRIIPATLGGMLLWSDLHWLNAGSERSGPFESGTPFGIRLAPKGPPFSGDQPLVVFKPEGWKRGEVLISMMLNVNEQNLPAAMRAIQEVMEKHGKPCTRVRIWGLDKGHPVADALVAHGADLHYRCDTLFLPTGVAWYGPKGSTAILQGAEEWLWL